MRIINPIYDVAFKYLMEDMEIARSLIGEIIGEDIHSLVFQPQEMSSKSKKYSILIFRLDFKATIQTSEGTYKTVLIELQKAKVYDDLMRFRRYLGENYSKQVEFTKANGIVEKQTLPIITIYFLGFPLPNIKTSVLKIDREYYDLIEQKKLNVKTEFVEKLTHDCFIILIKQLPPKERTELEGILQVFNQRFQVSTDPKLMEINENKMTKNYLTNKILSRLQKGATDQEILKQMIVEDEVENAIDKHVREKENFKAQLKTKEEELKNKNDELKTKEDELENKNEELKNKEDELDKQRKIIEDLKKRLDK